MTDEAEANGLRRQDEGGSSNQSELANALADSSSDLFYRGLAWLAEVRHPSGKIGIALILEVATRWESNRVPKRMQAERLRQIVGRLSLDQTALLQLSIAAQQLNAALRNAISEMLPADSRQSQVQRAESIRPAPLPSSAAGGEVAPTRRFASPNDASSAVAPARSEKRPLSTEERGSTVVLLTGGPDLEANRSLLQGFGFGVIAMGSVLQLETDLSSTSDVCGCVIDQSFLSMMKADDQKKLFRFLARYSSFLWLRVDERGLAINAAAVRQELKAARCLRESVASESLSIQPDGRLREGEISDIIVASDLLQTHDSVQYLPGELTLDECQLLTAAVRDQAQLTGDGKPLKLDCIETKMFSGGRSNARTIQVRVNRKAGSLVAKVDTKDRIIDEIRRYLQFIRRWEDELQPRAYFHGDSAAIIFGFLPDGNDSDRPAPMLEVRLHDLWNRQLFATASSLPSLARDAQLLAHGVAEGAKRLGNLNRKRPLPSEFESVANPSPIYLTQLEAEGMTWGFADEHRAARLRASNLYDIHKNAATVHGDVHLRNVLMRGDTEPHFIDYAGSGPGHPAIDLVRYELSLYFTGLRHFDSEEKSTEFCRRLSIDVATAAELAQEFPETHKCQANIVCIGGMIAARDTALEVLSSYSLGKEHYLAAKCLTAWQGLLMSGTPTSAVRSVINALTGAIP